MTPAIHLRIVGMLLIGLGLSHGFFNRYFGWTEELAGVSLLTRRVFFVHTFFIALVVTLCGAGSLVYTDALLRPGAVTRALLAAMALFWLCRLFVQFFVYDAAIWKGDRFRTGMHVAFSLFWMYLTGTYGWALVKVWR